MTNEPDPRVSAYSRFKNKQHLEGKKADLCICGPINPGFSEKVKCDECGRVCYYTDDNLDLKKKNIQKICHVCALKNHKKELPAFFIKMLEEIGVKKDE